MTGNAVAARSGSDLDGLFYAPFDWPGPVRHALSVLNPELLVLVETELWPLDERRPALVADKVGTANVTPVPMNRSTVVSFGGKILL